MDRPGSARTFTHLRNDEKYQYANPLSKAQAIKMSVTEDFSLEGRKSVQHLSPEKLEWEAKREEATKRVKVDQSQMNDDC